MHIYYLNIYCIPISANIMVTLIFNLVYIFIFTDKGGAFFLNEKKY